LLVHNTPGVIGLLFLILDLRLLGFLGKSGSQGDRHLLLHFEGDTEGVHFFLLNFLFLNLDLLNRLTGFFGNLLRNLVDHLLLYLIGDPKWIVGLLHLDLFHWSLRFLEIHFIEGTLHLLLDLLKNPKWIVDSLLLLSHHHLLWLLLHNFLGFLIFNLGCCMAFEEGLELGIGDRH
jgi:hypothetical protein